MAMRVKRTVEIAMSNYDTVSGACAFTYERKIGYATDNMQLTSEEVDLILRAWNGEFTNFTVKHLPLMIAMNDKSGLVAINTDGASSLIMGTGKGVWFICFFAPMDADKFGIMKECIQSAKNLEASVSIFDI
ncbi:MAG: hypothetical protein KAQ65_03170 [Candidatus Thorarchaeota archaeon]|nr:hypothetical protein [Candidatus Thorarchaeota archaeon]